MKAKDFIKKNHDVLIAPFSEVEFNDLTEGRVLFCFTVGPGHNPVMERQVRTAGYQMVVSTRRNAAGNLTEAITLALTRNGYAKIESITADEVRYACSGDDAAGNKLVYHCVPLPPNDSRGSGRWGLRKEG